MLMLGMMAAVAAGSTAATNDTLLADQFCQLYYPKAGVDGFPVCSEVRNSIVSDLSGPLPTLSLGDPSKPGLFFIHGWPDSAAEWAPQFAHFCAGATARFRCVAATWANFHPDLPDAPEDALEFTVQIDKLAATMRAANLVDPTLVIHDWGSFIGYQITHRYPTIMNRTISFDIGSGGHPNVTYQAQNRLAWSEKNSAPSVGSASYWWAPCPACAVWRTTWPYVSTLSFRGLVPALRPIATKPLLFLWGNMTRGEPRPANTKFFDQSWLDFVHSCPHGAVVEAPGDHWMHLRAPGADACQPSLASSL
eukprot:COSAG01_NODE_9231_length_2512_cov_5.002487_3_plen_307_part_00